MSKMVAPLPQAWRLLPDQTILQITGEDRVRFLHGQCTQEIRKLSSDTVACACVVSAKGRLIADFFVRSTPDALWLDADSDLREALFARLDRYVIADDVLIEDVSDTMRVAYGLGEAPPPPEGVIAHHGNRLGPAGWEWLFPVASEPEVRAALSGISPLTDADVATLRIAHGIARWGAELSEETLPPEAGLESRAISYDKGCYTGQEVISRIKSIGHVNRRVVGLRSEREISPGTAFFFDGKEAGVVTSWAGQIGLGYLLRRAGNPEVVSSADGVPLQICAFPLPFSLRN